MNVILSRFNEEVDLIDKFLIISISLIPLCLALSIFLADFLASLSGIILISILLKKKNLYFFKLIKKEIIFFGALYSIILISLILTEFKDQSFLASFFYFRYFLMSLSIFYLLKKYDFFFKILFNFFFISILIVIIDALIQLLFGQNTLGYEFSSIYSDDQHHLTGFFDKEKKLGSYLVRFFPLLLSFIYFYKKKIPIRYEIFIFSIITIVVFLSSERTASLLLFIIFFSYFIISRIRVYFLSFIILIFTFIFFNLEKNITTERGNVIAKLTYKYIYFTLEQSGLSLLFEGKRHPADKTMIRYYSFEHENLTFTGYHNFKKNPFFGSGVKTFYHECQKYFKLIQPKLNNRNNRLVCSTHPHNTYIQVLSETGIFAFFLIFFLFLKSAYENLRIIFQKKTNLDRVYFFVNLSIIINIMPLIPSGSFFNNWMCLVMFFPLGFWLYIREKINK